MFIPSHTHTSDSPTRIPLVVGYNPATRSISSIFHKHTFSHPPNFVLLLKYIPLVGPLFSARSSRTSPAGGHVKSGFFSSRSHIGLDSGFSSKFEAYLPKMSISRQIVSEIVAQLYSENSILTLLIFWGVDPKKILKGLYGVL